MFKHGISQKIDAMKEEILRDYRAGMTGPAVGEKYGCSTATIYIKLRDWGEPIRNRRLTAEEKSDILRRLAEGQSAGSIAKCLNRSVGIVCRIAKRRGIRITHRRCSHPKSAKNYSDEIGRLYRDNRWSMKKIAAALGLSPRMVSVEIDRRGWRLRRRGGPVHTIDTQFFNSVDREEVAYTLGMMMADGCVTERRHGITLALSDEDGVRKIAAAMRYGGPIRVTHPRPGLSITKPVYRLLTQDRQLYEALVRLGCVPNKTRLATFPSEQIVAARFHPHLVRGWFDGDGWLWRTAEGYWRWGICGTEAAIRGIASAIFAGAGVAVRVRSHSPQHPTLFVCESGRREIVESVVRWMYRDATLFLDRKYNMAIECCPELTRKDQR